MFENQVITVNNEVLQVLSIPEREEDVNKKETQIEVGLREWRGDILNKEKIQLQPMPKGMARQTCTKTSNHHTARLNRSKVSSGQRHFRNTISLKDEKCHSNQRYIFNLVSSCVRWPLVWLDFLLLGYFILFFLFYPYAKNRVASETHKPRDNYIKSLQAGYWALQGKRFQGTLSLHSNTLSNVHLSSCPCHFPLGGIPTQF